MCVCGRESVYLRLKSLSLVRINIKYHFILFLESGVVHLTGYTPESPLAQEYVEVSPEEDMIYVDEQGSDEPDLVRASQGESMVSGL